MSQLSSASPESASSSVRPASAARERLLRKADQLFYSEGIRAVGVEKLISESKVTRMTFYRHFPSKEDLIVAYLQRRSRLEQRNYFAAREANPNDPRGVFRQIAAEMLAEASAPGFHGCPYINAAAEYADPDHPVRRAVSAHRDWYRDELWRLATEFGHPDPDAVAAQLVILRDGAMVGCRLNDPAEVAAAWIQAGRGLIANREQ